MFYYYQHRTEFICIATSRCQTSKSINTFTRPILVNDTVGAVRPLTFRHKCVWYAHIMANSWPKNPTPQSMLHLPLSHTPYGFGITWPLARSLSHIQHAYTQPTKRSTCAATHSLTHHTCMSVCVSVCVCECMRAYWFTRFGAAFITICPQLLHASVFRPKIEKKIHHWPSLSWRRTKPSQ